MSIKIKYPFLTDRKFIKNYGQKNWHILKTEDSVFCRIKFKDPEISDSSVDGTVCFDCLSKWAYNNNPKKVKIIRPKDMGFVPSIVMRKDPVNPRGRWRWLVASKDQQVLLYKLYPDMSRLEIEVLTGGQASDLIDKARKENGENN